MADVIDFNDTPMARMKKLCDAKEQEIVRLTGELNKARTQIAQVRSVNELLKLQISDLLSTLRSMQANVATATKSVNNLLTSLPDIQ